MEQPAGKPAGRQPAGRPPATRQPAGRQPANRQPAGRQSLPDAGGRGATAAPRIESTEAYHAGKRRAEQRPTPTIVPFTPSTALSQALPRAVQAIPAARCGPRGPHGERAGRRGRGRRLVHGCRAVGRAPLRRRSSPALTTRFAGRRARTRGERPRRGSSRPSARRSGRCCSRRKSTARCTSSSSGSRRPSTAMWRGRRRRPWRSLLSCRVLCPRLCRCACSCSRRVVGSAETKKRRAVNQVAGAGTDVQGIALRGAGEWCRSFIHSSPMRRPTWHVPTSRKFL